MNYSIRYKDAMGITIRTEFLPFGDDEQASGYARDHAGKTAMVEVWKADALVVRLDRRASV